MAGFLSTGATAHPIGHEHDAGEALAPQWQMVRIRKAGGVNDHLAMHGADQEMILILFADPAGVGQAEEVEFLVAWSGAGLVSGNRLRQSHLVRDRRDPRARDVNLIMPPGPRNRHPRDRRGNTPRPSRARLALFLEHGRTRTAGSSGPTWFVGRGSGSSALHQPYHSLEIPPRSAEDSRPGRRGGGVLAALRSTTWGATRYAGGEA